jgi:hypothetical protein
MPWSFLLSCPIFANERNQHSETTTDKSHHDLSIHRIRQADCLRVRLLLPLLRFQLVAILGRLAIRGSSSRRQVRYISKSYQALVRVLHCLFARLFVL